MWDIPLLQLYYAWLLNNLQNIELIYCLLIHIIVGNSRRRCSRLVQRFQADSCCCQWSCLKYIPPDYHEPWHYNDLISFNASVTKLFTPQMPPSGLNNHMQILWTHGHVRIARVSHAILACPCVFWLVQRAKTCDKIWYSWPLLACSTIGKLPRNFLGILMTECALLGKKIPMGYH